MNYQKIARGLISSLCLSALALTQIAFAAVAGSAQDAEATNAPSAIIYDNGPFQTGTVSKSGVTAPSGTQWSELQNYFGNLTQTNTTLGFSAAQGSVRLADNFVVPVGETWTINSVITFGYLTGGGTTTPFTAGTLQIWNGRPGDTGSTVIFGDTTTNRLASSTDTNTYRIGNSANPPPGSTPGTTRRIWQNTLTVSPALVLPAGNYWIDWATTVNGTPATAHFSPSTTIVDTRGTILSNARQFNAGAWVDLADSGEGAGTNLVPDVAQDFPFKLDGTRSGARAVSYSRKADFNGDNLSDFTVTRAVSGAKTWFTTFNGGSTSAVTFGNSGDTNVAEDYDGDGKTDIAVWRTGTFAYYYILQSSNNTFRSDQFGQTGDDPTVVGDYDGDGKADPAVYRAGSGSNAGFFYYRPSTGAATAIRGISFGAAGDKPYPGDFDGDGRFDASVIRNNNGNAQIFQLRTTQGFTSTFYGLFSDRFVTGDFDGDSRNDLAVIRDSAGTLTWYIQTSTSNQFIGVNYGFSTVDTPIAGDFDGDNRTDLGVFRAGNFYTNGTLSAPKAVAYGQLGDTVPASYLIH